MREKFSNKRTTGKSAIGAVFCILILLASLATAINIHEEQNSSTNSNEFLSYTYLFAEPKTRTTFENNKDYSLIEMNGCLQIGKNAGEPMMPIKPVSLLLPPMKTVNDIQVTGNPVEYQIEDLDSKPIFPYQASVPFGETPGDFVVNNNVYSATLTYPGYLYDEYQIGYSRGYTILTINLHPLQYNPGEGTVKYYPEMTVNINLKDSSETNQFYQNNPEDRAWAESLVDNDAILDTYTTEVPIFSYPGGLCEPSGHYDYVIITTTFNSLHYWNTTSSTPYNWNSLMDHHETADGLACTLVTVQDINACTDYQGTNPFNDQQAHIREFCKDAYQDWETRYILIGGDGESSYIPARDMDTAYETDIDADIYWSNLDNNFNADSDNYWGEEGDSGFDLYAEMYIGRITCDIPQDVSNWINKNLYYGTSFDLEYLDNAAFYGGDTTWNCQGDDFEDYGAIKGTTNWLGPIPNNDGPFPTWAGFQYGFETWNAVNPENMFNLSVKWTAEPPNPGGWQGGSDSAAITGLKNAINNNQVTLLSGIAHANADMALDVSSSAWESQYTNNKPFFIHDFGCHCGDFDAADDGVLHSMLFHSATELAFGCIFNTCYGWGNFDSTNSSSAFQQKEFWSYFLDVQNKSGNLNAWQIGKGHAYSKDRMAATINWDYSTGTWRAIIEGCLLFGDPAQKIKIGEFSNPPAKPTLDGPIQGIYNQNLTYTAVTTEPDGEPIFYQFDWGFGDISNWFGPYASGIPISVSHSWSGMGSFLVKVIARDNRSATSEWSNILIVSITDNTPPDAPAIDGPTSGKVGETYQYNVSTTDVDNHSVCYRINWDEGATSNWSEFYPSGEEVVFSHVFEKSGSLRIQVQAMDEIGYVSGWTILVVSMPKNMALQTLFFKFLENHPILFRLLQLLFPQLGL